jgi:hypothetical protein
MLEILVRAAHHETRCRLRGNKNDFDQLNLTFTFGSKLLAGGLASGGFTSGLFGTSHFNCFC